MKVAIHINMDSAAFEDYPGELERILDTVLEKIAEAKAIADASHGFRYVLEVDSMHRLLDRNGNTVGYCRLEKS